MFTVSWPRGWLSLKLEHFPPLLDIRFFGPLVNLLDRINSLQICGTTLGLLVNSPDWIISLSKRGTDRLDCSVINLNMTPQLTCWEQYSLENWVPNEIQSHQPWHYPHPPQGLYPHPFETCWSWYFSENLVPMKTQSQQPWYHPHPHRDLYLHLDRRWKDQPRYFILLQRS